MYAKCNIPSAFTIICPLRMEPVTSELFGVNDLYVGVCLESVWAMMSSRRIYPHGWMTGISHLGIPQLTIFIIVNKAIVETKVIFANRGKPGFPTQPLCAQKRCRYVCKVALTVVWLQWSSEYVDKFKKPPQFQIWWKSVQPFSICNMRTDGVTERQGEADSCILQLSVGNTPNEPYLLFLLRIVHKSFHTFRLTKTMTCFH
jgi:hypothetical protein